MKTRHRKHNAVISLCDKNNLQTTKTQKDEDSWLLDDPVLDSILADIARESDQLLNDLAENNCPACGCPIRF